MNDSGLTIGIYRANVRDGGVGLVTEHLCSFRAVSYRICPYVRRLHEILTRSSVKRKCPNANSERKLARRSAALSARWRVCCGAR
ncbi:hypothetical protein EVAR_7490_1 [Eumeta japonica]|uniref:Uncharacterized protein n=1 Tax=Eumeta variegata TaxID=151549 RepID=A0A4C1Y4D1_EUMVA|nr:hypothetical protein EVAR_7490_1 [Eumeta japonica]